MLASTRRSLATLAVLTLGLAACGDDAADDTASETEAPADDGAAEDGTADDPADGAADAGTDDELPEGEDPAAAPESFEEGAIEEGEVLPGVRLEVPEEQNAEVQQQPLPTGAGYVASLPEQGGAVFVDVEYEGTSLDELLDGIDALVEAGQAELEDGPNDIDVEGADEAARVDLVDPTGEAQAIGVFASVDGVAVSLAVETPVGTDLDVDSIIDSLALDAERLTVEG
jgi:hypothetical protein